MEMEMGMGDCTRVVSVAIPTSLEEKVWHTHYVAGWGEA
jgi:hypothetical protein